jgi:hypothetical protein
VWRHSRAPSRDATPVRLRLPPLPLLCGAGRKGHAAAHSAASSATKHAPRSLALLLLLLLPPLLALLVGLWLELLQG